MTAPVNLNTGSASAGGVLVPDSLFAREVDRLVFARPCFMRLATVVPVSNRKTRLSKVTGGPSLGWVGEASVKPVTDIVFDSDDLVIKELAGILTWSDRLEAESISDPGVRSLIQEAIADSAGQQIDESLFDSHVTTLDPYAPTGLLRISGLPTVTTGIVDLGEDMRAMLRKIRVENYEPSAFVLHSAALDALLAIRASSGLLKYPSASEANPTLWGKPLIVCNNLPFGAATTSTGMKNPTTIVLGQWDKAVVGTMPTSISISDVAVVNSVSMFERDSTAIRYVANVGLAVRRKAAFCKLDCNV
jgi:HK97 family phage major capsid protein